MTMRLKGYFYDSEMGIVAQILEYGSIALRFRDGQYSGMIKAWSWHTMFEGYRAVVCNQGSTSSQLFDTVDPATYDIVMPFVFDGKQWTVSIYTTNKDIDVSELAKKHGGGGHKRAAGFQCKKLPFSLINIC